jgi:hypothetical protein
MSSNSFQGANSVSGVNSFGGVNSFDGVNSFGGNNSFQASPDSRNIQASQIKDTGLQSLLQDQFSPINSYSKIGVAPLGQVKSAADQYQSLDLSKLDDPTKDFLQPYLTGEMSSVNPTQAFISKSQLAAAQAEMQARNAAAQAHSSSSTAPNQLKSQVDAFIAGLPQLANVQAGSDKGATKYKSIYLDPMVKWANAGFIPGIDYTPPGWTRQQGNISKSDYHGGRDIPNGTLWRNGADTITYDPSYGYYIRNDNAYKDSSAQQFKEFLSAIVMNVGTAGLGSMLSTQALGIPAGAASFIDPIIGKSLSGAIGAGLSGGNIGAAALKGAALGGLGAIGSSISSLLPKELQPFTGLGISSGLGGLNSLLSGGQFGQGALGGLTSSALGLAGNYLSGGSSPQNIPGVGVNLAKALLTQQLNKRRRA